MTGGGLSRARLGRMGEVMGSYVKRGEVPGVVALVARRGEVHAGAARTMAAGGSDPVRRDTLFRVTPMTKPVTAAAAMILAEECHLRLDGPVEDTLPANPPITVRDLLTFTMGFGGILAPPGIYPIQDALKVLSLAQPDPPGPDEWIRRPGTLPLIHQPGERWMYSTGTHVLGVLIARASGQPFETFLRERLFEPLGMTGTGFAVPESELGGYWPDPATGALTPNPRPKIAGAARRPSPPEPGTRRPGSSPPSMTTWPSPRCCTAAASTTASASCPALGRDHDHRPALPRPESSVRVLARLLRQPRLGLRRVGRHQARPPRRPGRHLRLGRRLGHHLALRPREDMITILMTQVAWTSPNPPNICLDFWATAYQAIDD